MIKGNRNVHICCNEETYAVIQQLIKANSNLIFVMTFPNSPNVEMEHEENLQDLAEDKITLGKLLIEQLNSLKHVEGVQKIQRKINQEIKFLEKVFKTNSLKINHVMCSNLTHYEFLVNVLIRQKNIVHVDCGFPVEDRPNPLRVDIVCDNGAKWIKVIARNPKSLNDAAKGRASYGARSIVDQAAEFLEAASQNPYMFQPPKVAFHFTHRIEGELLEDLLNTGVDIVINGTETAPSLDKCDNLNVELLNLDITTLLAYVSGLTNGSSNWVFEEPILTEQAERERENPIKPVLDDLFRGKKLICCETAVQSFREITSLLAGPNEQQRADDFLKRIEILPDIPEIPEELRVLSVGGKIKPRSLKIFAFGIKMKAVTVTSNEGFIRSSKMQGINIPVFVHQARALTELKEENARTLKN